jgi:hypothetical protein
MSTEPAIPALLRGLVDDAALFPPGNAPMPVAVAEHRRHRAAPYSEFVGPLLCPAGRWDELGDHLAEEPLDVGLIGDAGAGHLMETARRALADPRVRLVQLECPAGAGPVAARDTGLLLDTIGDESVNLFVELPRGEGWLDAVGVLAELPTRHFVGAKLRTGGTTAAAFPTDDELAAFVARAMDADHPFKLTAGLHRAVRHTDPATGFEHHGYLNVLVAVCLGWLDRRPFDGVREAIAARSAAPLVAAARRMAGQPGEAAESRTWFWSYGSCSVAEPLTDLVELGLLDRGLLAHLPVRKEPA